MHEETYSAFFTPRDEEPSHSSSEEKSLEFGWLEIKRTRKQKYEGKTEEVLYKIYFLLLQKVVSKNKLPRSPLSGLPQGEAHGTCEHHTRTITYPIRICCPDHWLKWASLAMSFRQLATAHVLPPSDGVSGHLLLLAFRICLWKRTSKLRFLMFLSFPLLWHGFQRTLLNHRLLWWSKSYQNTKT